MADTLRSFAELLAQIPDNTSQLISAQDVRELIYALPNEVGSVEEGADFVVPQSDAVWTTVPPLSPSPAIFTAAWLVDANNALVPDYGSLPVDVPPLLERVLNMQVWARITRNSQPVGLYEGRMIRDGVQLGESVDLEIDADGATLQLGDISTYRPAELVPYTWQLRPVGHSTSVTVHAWQMTTVGSLL